MQYLSTPESLQMVPELVRFVCCVIHPPNEILQSDIVPRWALIGWLLSLCQVVCSYTVYIAPFLWTVQSRRFSRGKSKRSEHLVATSNDTGILHAVNITNDLASPYLTCIYVACYM